MWHSSISDLQGEVQALQLLQFQHHHNHHHHLPLAHHHQSHHQQQSHQLSHNHHQTPIHHLQTDSLFRSGASSSSSGALSSTTTAASAASRLLGLQSAAAVLAGAAASSDPKDMALAAAVTTLRERYWEEEFHLHHHQSLASTSSSSSTDGIIQTSSSSAHIQTSAHLQHNHHLAASLAPFFLWYEQEEKDLNKKVKYAEDSSFGSMPYNLYDPMLAAAYWYPPTTAWSRVSAFRPWSPMVGKDGKPCVPSQHSSFLRESVPQTLPSFLSHGPPVLLNPERVVPISETERFERHYQPNVALAPASAQLQASQKTAVVPSASPYSSPAPKSACHLDDSASHKALLSNPEMEVSTDTDETLSDSTIGAESTDYVPEKDMAVLSKSPDMESAPDTPVNTEAELEPIQKLLDERGLGSDVVEQVMNEVDKLRTKYKEELAIAIQAKKSLQQEFEFHKISSKEKLREASETKRCLRKEIRQAQLEHEKQMKDALEAQQQLRRELEATRIRRGDKIHEVAARANLAAENEQLRARLEAVEAELGQTRKSGIGQEVGSAKPLTSCTESPIIKQEVVDDDESLHSEKSTGE